MCCGWDREKEGREGGKEGEGRQEGEDRWGIKESQDRKDRERIEKRRSIAWRMRGGDRDSHGIGIFLLVNVLLSPPLTVCTARNVQRQGKIQLKIVHRCYLILSSSSHSRSYLLFFLFLLS